MTQEYIILEHLKKHGSITPREALDLYGCFRLGARIYNLKHRGVAISRTMVEGVNRMGAPVRYAKYSIDRGTEE